MSETYLTKKGYQKLVEDLEYLKTVKRREISKAIGAARAHGDITENADYDAAKDAQGMNEKRIAELEAKLAGARIIEDEDIDNLTSFIRMQGGPVYEESIAESGKKVESGAHSDELFDDAVKAVLQAKQASASLLQRRLRVGYTRAARLLDLMEDAGVVGPFCGSKAREILVDPEQFLTEKESV